MTVRLAQQSGVVGRVVFMGRFQITDLSGAVVMPKSKKATALLAYLLYSRQTPIARDLAVDLFWSDRGTEQGRASLRQVLRDIRLALTEFPDDCLEFERRTLAIRGNMFDFDFAGDFDRQSMHLTGEFLSGLDPVSPVFDDWLETERRSLRNRQSAMLEAAIDGAAGDADRASAAETLLTLEPENEQAAQAAIGAYAALGKLRKAKEVGDRLGKVLAADGLQMSDQTKELLRRASGQAPTTAPRSAGPPVLALSPVTTLGFVSEDDVGFLNNLLIARLGEVREIRFKLDTHRENSANGWGDNTDADFVLTGAAGLENGQLHCNTSLIAAADRQHQTSIRTRVPFDEPIGALTMVADQIVARVVPSVEHVRADALPQDQSAWSAFDNYVHAKSILNRATEVSYAEQALPFLEQARRADPNLIVVYPLLISILNSRYRATRPGFDVAQDVDLALNLCKRAQVLDGNFANLHIAQAWCLMRRREFALAEQSVEEAVALAPYEATRINSIGSVFLMLGDHDRAAKFFEQARFLQHNGLDFQTTDLGELCYFQRNYDDAISFLKIGEARNPDFARIILAAALAQVGELAEAARVADNVLAGMAGRWQGNQPFTVERASQWIVDDYPLRREVDFDNLVEGMTKAGFRFGNSPDFD